MLLALAMMLGLMPSVILTAAEAVSYTYYTVSGNTAVKNDN